MTKKELDETVDSHKIQETTIQLYSSIDYLEDVHTAQIMKRISQLNLRVTRFFDLQYSTNTFKDHNNFKEDFYRWIEEEFTDFCIFEHAVHCFLEDIYIKFLIYPLQGQMTLVKIAIKTQSTDSFIKTKEFITLALNTKFHKLSHTSITIDWYIKDNDGISERSRTGKDHDCDLHF